MLNLFWLGTFLQYFVKLVLLKMKNSLIDKLNFKKLIFLKIYFYLKIFKAFICILHMEKLILRYFINKTYIISRKILIIFNSANNVLSVSL